MNTWAFNKFGHLLHNIEQFSGDPRQPTAQLTPKPTAKSGKLKTGSDKPLYTLCVIASFKNNMYRLKEWIQHHLWQGVEHFYLIDEGSVDDYWTEIESYIRKKLVTIDMVGEVKHPRDKRDVAFKRYKNKSTWFAIIDTNTFLYSTPVNKLTLRDTVQKLEPDVAALYMHGRVFSANDSSPCVRKSATWRSLKPLDVPQGIVRSSLTTSLRENVHEHKPGRSVYNADIRANVYAKKVPEEVKDSYLADALEKINPKRCW
jgi:hypothetical protein